MKHAAHSHYKPGNSAWLKDLPDTWDQVRGRYVFSVNPPSRRARQMNENDEVSFVPMEAIGEYGGLNPDRTRTLDEIGAGYTAFEEGDIIIAKITPCFENGKCAIAHGLKNGVGFGTTELHVLRTCERIDTRFLFYVTISHPFRMLGEYEMYGAGGQKRIPSDFVKDFRTPLPPLHQQEDIARFLDAKTAQIDALIAKKRELVEKIKEKRQALIAHAVTRGLPSEAAKAAGFSPSTAMKKSTVEWLGRVPKHWKIHQLKWAILFQRGHDLPSEQREDGNVPLVTSAGISGTHNIAVAKGPGIVTGRYGTIGKFHLIRDDYWPLNTTLYSSDMHGNVPEYLTYLLEYLSPLVLLHSVKSAVPGVDRNDLHPTIIALPPVSEQKAIAEYLDRESVTISTLTEKVLAAISRLTEYRQALITSAVTGKIDVRHWEGPREAA